MSETQSCDHSLCDRDAQNDGYCGTCHATDCDADTDAHDPFCSRECYPGPSAADTNKADLRGYCATDGCQNARAAGADLCSDCLGEKYVGEQECERDGCSNWARPNSTTYCPAHS